MRNITKGLSAEHQNILKVIDVVLNECEQLEKGKAIDVEFFRKIISFIKNYADGFHHVKEEEILFTAMLKEMDNMHCNPIPVMLHEHDAGREYVKGMEEALLQDNVYKLIENAGGYCFLLQNHIDKEDNVLYPMAEQALNDTQKKQVETLYQKVSEKDFISKDVNVLIEEMLHQSAGNIVE